MPRMSCPHKNIAKWHLFQTNQNIFSTEKATKLSDTSCPQHSDEHIDTPPIDLQSTVEYIYNKNTIPGNLQEAAAKSKTFPSRYLPVETTCMIYDGEIALDEPALITAKAKTITMESIIDSVMLTDSVEYLNPCAEFIKAQQQTNPKQISKRRGQKQAERRKRANNRGNVKRLVETG